MSPLIQETLEELYRFITILADNRLYSWLILSNKYEYDYEVLAPLAMTKVPPSPIPQLPALPTKDELPSEKWVSLVLTQLSLLAKAKKPTNSLNLSIFEQKEKEINLLESINQQIKAAKEQVDLTEAVLNLKSALGLADTDEQAELLPQTETILQFESNLSQSQARFDEIDREIEASFNQNLPRESATYFTTDDIEQADERLYRNLKEITRLLGRELIDNQPQFTTLLETTEPNPTLEDYENLIDPLEIKPATLNNFQQDKVFAYMQVAGPNPVMLKQIEKFDSRLPITNEQYQTIVPQDSLEAALQEGRLYLADYSKLGTLTNGNFGGIQKYIYDPVALFAVPPDKHPDQNLLSIAIRCQHTVGDIFTPLDGDSWMAAKTVLQMADSNYHELISHLAQTHLFIEPFVLATNRCFTDQNHQVRRLLKPHLEGTILINYGAHNRLLAPKGAVDSLLSATIGSNTQLAIKEAQSHLANFNDVAFPRTLEKRGVNNSKQLPIYPYRDDGKKIWDAITQWVQEYLGLFYFSDQSVETDSQLQKWASELRSKGHCNIGEAGDGQIKTLDYLIEAISTIIFTASVQHAAVNFPQSGLMSYAPAFPLGCYSPAPTSSQQDQDFMELLPPLERAELQIQVLYLLGSVYYTKLGDYSGSHFQNTQVKNVLDKFKLKLTEIENTILQEDSQRLVSYRYLLPSKIPQSINI